MFLRLCVVGLVFAVQGTLAKEVDPLEVALGGYQKEMPAGCQIKSAAMKLAFACSAIQSRDANPRFFGSIDAMEPGSSATSSTGVNFCYNSLVNVSKNGDVLRIQVIRDVGSSAKRVNYSVKQSSLKSEAGEFVLPLPDQKGECFAYTAGSRSKCSKGFLGLGGTDIGMTLKINIEDPGRISHALTAEPRVIAEARRNGSQVSGTSPEVNAEETTKTAIAYARQQLVAQAKEKIRLRGSVAGVSGAHDISGFELCDGMLTAMENSLKAPPPRDPEDEKVLSKYRAQLGDIKSSITPGGSGDGSGIREGTGGR